MKRNWDVIVIGGGHAGTEAAAVSWRRGARTLLVTHRFDRLGEMSCNPALGGLGKGHLLREIDALDGIMASAGDSAAIQYRLLNRSRGPAAQGPRAQIDRALYRRAVQRIVREMQGLCVVEAEVIDIRVTGGRVCGVVLADDSLIGSGAVVLTTGTFLRGMIHLGYESWPAGRFGDSAAVRLGARVADLGVTTGRLKTGTPPRLDGRTIEWSRVDRQPGDASPVFLSFFTEAESAPQVECGVTATNERTHAIVRANLGGSATYGGRIDGSGPRYCPSIEDKVVRFAERTSHQVFLEPEGLNDETVYPNGISTSLPASVQEEAVRSIQGLESVEIIRPGYAIEYDYVDPRALGPTLAVEDVEGLYLAGQINGTTGYEEAGAQGVVAGLNAACFSLGDGGVVFDRGSSFIGVMIDDLVTRGVTEPYRMFTSRAEYRLRLRPDNADQRLTPLGIRAGCVGELRRRRFEEKAEALARARALAVELRLSPSEAAARGFAAKRDGARRNALELIADAANEPEAVRRAFPEFSGVSEATLKQLVCDVLYAPYLRRQEEEIARLRRDEGVVLPRGLRYEDLPGLSSELVGKLSQVRPETLAQASRMEGMTPSALSVLLVAARRASGGGAGAS